MTDSSSATPRRRNSQDRAARRHARQSGVSAEAPAFIRREIPYYELVSDEGLSHIEEMSERLLSEIGMDIRNDDAARNLFKAAGADVDGDRVRFDRGLVRSLCATAPNQFT